MTTTTAPPPLDPDAPASWRARRSADLARRAELERDATGRKLTAAEMQEWREIRRRLDETLAAWALRTGRG